MPIKTPASRIIIKLRILQSHKASDVVLLLTGLRRMTSRVLSVATPFGVCTILVVGATFPAFGIPDTDPETDSFHSLLTSVLKLILECIVEDCDEV